MSDAHMKLVADLDNSRVNKAYREIETGAARSTSKAAQEFAKMDRANAASAAVMQRRLGGFAGAGGSRAGAVALQAQDIAVQLQMGTRLTTIIAQQGSQLASIFGPGGAIIGGAVAIGGALTMVGSNANQAFEDLINGSKESRKELEKLGKFASSGDLMTGIEKFHKQIEDLGEKASGGGSVMDVLKGGLGVLLGGKSQKEQQSDAIKEGGRNFAAMVKARNDLANASDREARIAELRAKGRTKEAEAMEKQLVIEKKISEIDNTSLDKGTKETLIANLKRSAAAQAMAEGQAAEDKRKKEQVGQAGQAILDRAEELGKTPQQRRAERQDAAEEKRNRRRAIEAQINEEDRDRRKEFGMTPRPKGLTTGERKDRMDALTQAAKFQKENKVTTELSKDAIQDLVTAIGKLLAK